MKDIDKLKFFKSNDPWILAEDIPDIDFQFSQIWLSSFVNNLKQTIGRNYEKILCIYKGYNLKFYYGEKDSDELAKHILKLILDNPKFGEKINIEIRRLSKKFKKFSEKISHEFLRKLSNKDLASLYKELDDIHTELYTWGWVPNAVDMFHANFTNYLKNIIAFKIPEDRVSQALMSLSTSPEKSIVQQEHESFLNLVQLKQKGASEIKLNKAISKHLKEYFYLKHLWIGKEGVYTIEYYKSEIEKFIASGENAGELLEKETKILKETIDDRKKLIKELKLNKNQIKIFDIYADFAVTKLIRRDAQIFWAYKMDFVFQELSNRFGISFMESRFLFTDEIIEGLKKGEFWEELKKEVKERTKYCVYYAEYGSDVLFFGEDAKKLENSLKSDSLEGVTELKGQTACVGKVKGKVRIINSIDDMKKMEQGDILVSIATNPDIVPAMKKAGAIVTEQGGITSHAAIVSRELRVPCVIGTKIATKVLKDGMMVEVDANMGVVKIIN
jgi:phosphohistidine swiveling domain-containing protein